VVLAFQVTFTVAAQQPAAGGPSKAATKVAPANDVFSGTVSESVPNSVTVVRKVPAKADESRVFIVDKDTKIEGKLKVGARVTVGFKADAEGGIHALRVIVRADAKTNAAPVRANSTGP